MNECGAAVALTAVKWPGNDLMRKLWSWRHFKFMRPGKSPNEKLNEFLLKFIEIYLVEINRKIC